MMSNRSHENDPMHPFAASRRNNFESSQYQNNAGNAAESIPNPSNNPGMRLNEGHGRRTRNFNNLTREQLETVRKFLWRHLSTTTEIMYDGEGAQRRISGLRVMLQEPFERDVFGDDEGVAVEPVRYDPRNHRYQQRRRHPIVEAFYSILDWYKRHIVDADPVLLLVMIFASLLSLYVFVVLDSDSPSLCRIKNQLKSIWREEPVRPKTFSENVIDFICAQLRKLFNIH